MSRATAALTLRQLRPPRRTDSIVSQIKDLIYGGALRPGERLPSERDLARAWRVGRPTVREAIQQLEGLGFIEVQRARGSFVRSVTADTVERPLRRMLEEESRLVAQILDVRMALEGWVAAEAARRATAREVRHIEALAAQITAAAERGEPLSALDQAFHRALVDATKNTVMLHMMETLTSLIGAVRTFKKRVGFRQTRGRSFTDCHREIARAIAAREPEKAREAMVAHLAMVKEMLEEAERAAPPPAGARRSRAVTRGGQAR